MNNVSQETTREPRQQLTTNLPPRLWEHVKIEAVKRKTSAGRILELALCQHFGIEPEEEDSNAA